MTKTEVAKRMKNDNIDLHEDALRYVSKCLEDAAALNDLTAHISREIDISSGRVRTLFPLGAPDRILPGIHDVLTAFILDAGLILAEHIQAYLAGGSERLVIFPDLSFDADSPAVSRMMERLYTFGKQLYHVILPQDATLEFTNKIERQAGSPWLTICAMSRTPGRWATNERRFAADADDLREVAVNTVALAVQAYDGEGYLIWSKH